MARVAANGAELTSSGACDEVATAFESWRANSYPITGDESACAIPHPHDPEIMSMLVPFGEPVQGGATNMDTASGFCRARRFGTSSPRTRDT